MREIKFRGKRIDNGEWVYGDITRRRSRFITHLDTTYGVSDEYGIFCAVDPETVGQFSGLKTDTGKVVYEGDIITVPELISDVKDFIDVVEFENGAFHLARARDILVCQELMDEGVSVIGNMWDNPELLITEEDGETD